MTLTASVLAGELGVHPLVAEVLRRRGCDTLASARAFLDPAAYTPAPASALPDIAPAVARLRAAIAAGERIRIWGDFDVDGQTSTSVLFEGLRALGAQVDYTVPNRATHSHGLNDDGIRQALADGVAVLLTCDCGVSDFEPLALALCRFTSTAIGLGLSGVGT